MKAYTDFDTFKQGFRDIGMYNHFGYDGLKALFNYFESLEEETGETIEFDPIIICSEYTLYNNLEELKNDYKYLKDVESLNDIAEYTVVIPVKDDSFIIGEL